MEDFQSGEEVNKFALSLCWWTAVQQYHISDTQAKYHQ